MNDRIKKLREQSLNAVNRISAERALLVTEFYKSSQMLEFSVPVRRALAFEHILKNKKHTASSMIMARIFIDAVFFSVFFFSSGLFDVSIDK